MNIKNTVTLSDPYLRYAEELVENGQFPSVEKVVEAGLDNLMQSEELTPEGNDVVTAMADEIRRRLETPADQFLPWDGDAMADRIKAKLEEKYKQRG
jgi:antitoxin ParD1/3/4